jgi:hypothetical protein
MSDILAAELLCAFWKLGAPDASIPLIGGKLDRALEDCIALLPEGLSGKLDFSTTSVGRRAIGLDDIVLAGQQAMMIEVDGTRFAEGRTTLTTSLARMIVVEAGMSTLQATSIGRSLVQAAGVELPSALPLSN